MTSANSTTASFMCQCVLLARLHQAFKKTKKKEKKKTPHKRLIIPRACLPSDPAAATGRSPLASVVPLEVQSLTAACCAVMQCCPMVDAWLLPRLAEHMAEWRAFTSSLWFLHTIELRTAVHSHSACLFGRQVHHGVPLSCSGAAPKDKQADRETGNTPRAKGPM